jgi:hypothetical protein
VKIVLDTTILVRANEHSNGLARELLTNICVQRMTTFSKNLPVTTLIGWESPFSTTSLLFLHTENRTPAPGKFAMAAGLLILTIAMGIGIFGAALGMWLPRI